MSEYNSRTGAYRTKRRRGGRQAVFITIFLIFAALCIFLALKPEMVKEIVKGSSNAEIKSKLDTLANAEPPEWIDVQILPENCDSRDGVKLDDIKNIVVHYVGNPGTTAKQNRSYYANPGTTVNSHFLVGLDGEIIQCLPLNERSAATSHRNPDTISIEVCHPDDSGVFTDASYDALIELVAWLCEVCDFDADDVIRHYDATSKECPRYYVLNENEWLQMKADIADAILEREAAKVPENAMDRWQQQ